MTDDQARSAAIPLLFADKDEHEIGKDYGRGWIVLRPRANGVWLATGERGVGHDEPSQLHGFSMTFAEAAELRDALAVVVPPETESTETRQWHSPICDGCGKPIRSENDRNAGSYTIRTRFGRKIEKSGTWHRTHTPKEFYEHWGRW